MECSNTLKALEMKVMRTASLRAFTPNLGPMEMNSSGPSASIVGDFQRAILIAVSRLEGQAYGSQIRDEVQILTQRQVHLPQVYAALARLEVLQLVRSDADKEKSVGLRGRTRRYYVLTARGLRLLSDDVRHSDSVGPKDPFAYESGEKKASTA